MNKQEKTIQNPQKKTEDVRQQIERMDTEGNVHTKEELKHNQKNIEAQKKTRLP